MKLRNIVGFLTFFVVATVNSANAVPLMVFGLGKGANSNGPQVMTIQFTSTLSAATGNLQISFITGGAPSLTTNVCLYPTYVSGSSCTGTPVCATATNTWNTGLPLNNNTTPFYAGFTQSGLDVLAAKTGFSPVDYGCLVVNLAYSSSTGDSFSPNTDQHFCQLRSSGGHFEPNQCEPTVSFFGSISSLRIF